MARSSRFAFPMPGRKPAGSRSTAEDKLTLESRPRSGSPLNASKATRLLGMGSTIHSPPANLLSPPPLSSISVTITDSDYESDNATQAPSIPPKSRLRVPPPHNVGSTRAGSWASSQAVGNIVEEYATNSIGPSTIRHYQSNRSSSIPQDNSDSNRSPLSAHPLTQDFPNHEMRLRRGKTVDQSSLAPSVHSRNDASDVSDSESWATSISSRRKPPKLNIAKLMPKPRSQTSSPSSLLSPTRATNSPQPLSAASVESFQFRTMRKGSVGPPASVKSMKSFESRPGVFRISPPKNRVLENDPLDNAKVNVRRPPRGIQHWFEGLEEESSEDEDVEEESTTASPPPIKTTDLHPPRKSSLGRLLEHGNDYRLPRLAYRKPALSAVEDNSPLEYANPEYERVRHSSHASLESNKTGATGASAGTKQSKLSKTDLATTSLLSISSDDEDDDFGRECESTTAEPVPTIDEPSSDSGGEVIIGKATAFEVPSTKRNASTKSKASALSTLTSSSSAGTIDMVYMMPPLPSIPSSPMMEGSLSRSASRSHRAGLVRPPSAILEVDDRPQTADAAAEDNESASPSSPRARSIHSIRTCRSEPRRAENTHTLMAVTEEEQQLLEMMRRKRALMAKQSFAQGYKTAMEVEDKQARSPVETQLPPRTSGFLSLSSPINEVIESFPAPARTPDSSTRSRSRPRPANINTSFTPTPPRSSARQSNSTSSTERGYTSYRESVVTTESSSFHLATPCFTPLDPFPTPIESPTRTLTTASATSPTSASQHSALTSPATPAPSHSDASIDVKVAGSESNTSAGEEDLDAHSPVIPMPIPIPSPLPMISPYGSQASNVKMLLSEKRTSGLRARRLTMSDIHATLDEAARALSPEHHISRIPSKRSSGSLRGTGRRSRRPSRASTHSSSGTIRNLAFPTGPGSGKADVSAFTTLSPRQSRSFNSLRRESVLSFESSRLSASEDVLAAWGSLGGWRDIDLGHRNRT